MKVDVGSRSPTGSNLQGTASEIKATVADARKIVDQVKAGVAPYQAILNGGTAKMRPVCMVVLTTVLGSIPLLLDPFFSGLAVVIIFGLTFATFLCLIVTPVLYAIFYGVEKDTPPLRVPESPLPPDSATRADAPV